MSQTVTTSTTPVKPRRRASSNLRLSNNEIHEHSSTEDYVNSAVADPPAINNETSRPKVSAIKLLKKNFNAWDPTLYLENRASVARDHLGMQKNLICSF
jgi:hypothetical protein